MKELKRTIYESYDGQIFDTKEACLNHETEHEILIFLESGQLYDGTSSFKDVVREILKCYTITPK